MGTKGAPRYLFWYTLVPLTFPGYMKVRKRPSSFQRLFDGIRRVVSIRRSKLLCYESKILFKSQFQSLSVHVLQRLAYLADAITVLFSLD
jgi:hypothetical protein